MLILSVALIADQALKLWVKTNMHLGESIRVSGWFFIDFVENNGMAFGMTFGSKLLLSLFRIVAIAGIGYYLWKLVRSPHRIGFVACVSMILAGAAGNMVDSMFYGLVFSESTYYNVSSFVDFGHGYAPFLYGKVVDMFHFPLFTATWPDWLPIVGGDEFEFFSPVFNIADACISVGIALLVLFYRKDLDTLLHGRKDCADKET